MSNDSAESTEATLVSFCREFVPNPYLCYTGHGLYALFFARLYNAFSEDSRYFDFLGRTICAIQKEYPARGKLGGSRRQYRDISVVNPPEAARDHKHVYDHPPLAASSNSA